MIRLIRRLLRERRGTSLTEFGLLAPVMIALWMGLGDILYQAYLQSVLNGAVQKAGRDSGIEGAPTSTLDTRVQTAVRQLSQTATFVSTRRNYDTFTEVAPEPFVDTNGNGVRNPGECFTDQNINGTWDADPGAAGQGGAGAVTLYTMTVTYPRLFPVWGFFPGATTTQSISASTLLKNQPYATQSTTTAVTVCT
ncbi:MAG: hypothetical protein C0476_02525 [Sphingomonas sp.]|nr:hypothetical protein [Sphingomonas sp.]